MHWLLRVPICLARNIICETAFLWLVLEAKFSGRNLVTRGLVFELQKWGLFTGVFELKLPIVLFSKIVDTSHWARLHKLKETKLLPTEHS